MTHLAFLGNQLQIFLQLILYLNLEKTTDILHIKKHGGFHSDVDRDYSLQSSPGRYILDYPEDRSSKSL
jgi:hypothetical protein